VGVEGVKILVDGSLRSVTDKEGYYKLDQVYVNAIFNLNLYHIPCSSCKPAKLVVTQPLLVNFLRLLESRVKNMARFLKVMY
jgi:hypothetical protein